MRKDVKTSDIISLRLRGMSLAAIGKMYSMTPEAIAYRIKGCLKALLDESSTAYVENKSAILSATEKKILDELTDRKKIKKANLSSLAYAFSQIYGANRLEQGLSTQNIAYKEILSEKEKISEKIRELELKLTSSEENIIANDNQHENFQQSQE